MPGINTGGRSFTADVESPLFLFVLGYSFSPKDSELLCACRIAFYFCTRPSSAEGGGEPTDSGFMLVLELPIMF